MEKIDVVSKTLQICDRERGYCSGSPDAEDVRSGAAE